ncbi:GNAT family N-acetyltransferase [Mesorhizobium sp. SP-1A]|uniref:GNAT family N-acetyltransferase n=1 Tax=Mesorhizobium sp. SP-1A TaxID=3077840 RepID=UPI0028F74035|nr:GNAT family N-acetyltransferase [Mesorhizobium sp. SP-1A]
MVKVARLTIRPARPEDAEDIHAGLRGIAETIGAPHKVKSTPDDIRNFGFGENAAFEVLIAEIDSRFAGMCLYFPIFSSWLGRPGVFVQDLFVAESFRGMKVGEKLLRRLAHDIDTQGGVYIELAVDTGNLAAQRFYERIGIAHQGDDQVHRIAGDAFRAFAKNDEEHE